MYRLVILCLAVLLLGGLAAALQRETLQPGEDPAALTVQPDRPKPQSQRNREGTVFKDKHVFFRQTGDRTVLYTVEDNQRFTCLENLALDRILTAAAEKPNRQFWKVDGEFTEFRKENYVLIRRAVVAPYPAQDVSVVP